MNFEGWAKIAPIFTAFGALCSAGAAGLSWQAAQAGWHAQGTRQAWVTNHELLAKSHEMLIEDNSLLEILGINMEQLKKDKITPKELVFIITNLDAGNALYRILDSCKVSAADLTERRKSFLSNSKVRLARKNHLRGKLFYDTPWMSAVDTYIAEYESFHKNDATLSK